MQVSRRNLGQEIRKFFSVKTQLPSICMILALSLPR